jgi:hypothetical protein
MLVNLSGAFTAEVFKCENGKNIGEEVTSGRADFHATTCNCIALKEK